MPMSIQQIPIPPNSTLNSAGLKLFQKQERSSSPTSFCAYLCTFCPGTSFASMELLEQHIQGDHRQQQGGKQFKKEQEEEKEQDMEQDMEEQPFGMAIESATGAAVDEQQHLEAANPPSDSPCGLVPSLPSPGSTSTASSNCSSSLATLSKEGSNGGGNGMSADLTCKKCPGGRVFDCREQLDLHVANTHRDRPHYNCAKCGAMFSVKRELATHNRIHSGEQPHQCGECGKEFGTRQLLKKHNMWHTGERSHVCDHCGKAFFQKGHLTQHLMIHNGERPHQCHLCQKTFIFKFDLNRHLKIHSDRSFVCQKCAKCFQLEGELAQHLAKCRAGTRERGSGKRSSGASHKAKNSPYGPSPAKSSSPSEGPNEKPIEPPVQMPFAHAPMPQRENNSPPLPPSIGQLAASLFAVQQQQSVGAVMFGQQNGGGQVGQQFPCLLCPQKFANQTAYLMHWGNAHLRGNLPTGIGTDADLGEPHSDIPSDTSSSCQKLLPVSSPGSCSSPPSSSSLGQFEQHFPLLTAMPSQSSCHQMLVHNAGCPNCLAERQRLAEKERELGQMRAELDRIRVLLLRFGALFSLGHNGIGPTMPSASSSPNANGLLGQWLLGQFPPSN